MNYNYFLNFFFYFFLYHVNNNTKLNRGVIIEHELRADAYIELKLTLRYIQVRNKERLQITGSVRASCSRATFASEGSGLTGRRQTWRELQLNITRVNEQSCT